MSNSIKTIFGIVVMIAFFGWLGYDSWEQSRTVVLDNPTDQEISFQIDGVDYKLEPRANQSIKMKSGEHFFKMGEQETRFVKSAFSLSWSIFMGHDKPLSVLNPTKSTYILWHEIYGGENMGDEELENILPKYECETDGKPDICDYEEIDTLYFERIVSYGLNEQLPNQIKVSHKQYDIRSKLFRLSKFLSYMEK